MEFRIKTNIGRDEVVIKDVPTHGKGTRPKVSLSIVERDGSTRVVEILVAEFKRVAKAL